MNIQPLGDHLVVRRDEAAEQMESGLYIPGKSAEPPNTGVVVAAGPGVAPGLFGARVLFHRHAPAEISVGGETLLVLNAPHIIAVIGDDGATN